MENEDFSSELKNFVKKIITVVIGLILIAGVIALFLKLDFAIILFGIGILSAVIGAYLGGPNSFDPKNPQMSHRNPFEHPSAEKLRARIMHVVKNSVPFYSFENVLLIAGLTAIALSLPFICQIMF